MYDPTVGRFITEDPIGFDGADTNLYRYVSNNPINAIDPTGLAAEEKPASQASARAKELERILPYRLDMLKQIAKRTKEVERFGAILKGTDPNAKPPYKFFECVSKKSREKVKNEFGQKEPYGATRSPFKWWGSAKMRGGLLPKPGADGKIDLDAGGKLDKDYPIEFDWHTHPHDGDPWPSTGDGDMCKRHDMVGVMIRYIGRRMRGGKIEDDWAIWIIDTDGKTYEYKPPAAPGN